ncbi:MAG: hypothetical protein ACE144_14520 [Thermodesulfobacteriota bacterium]
MVENGKEKQREMNLKELQNLRGELWIILPFFIASLYFFLFSFRYKLEARTVPMLIGAATTLLTGMRLFHIIFPRSRIGQFKEAGLAGEFDSLKEEIEEETLKGKYEEAPAKEITFREERKAFYALIASFGAFLFFGYMVGAFFVIVGTSYYYGYKHKAHLLISVVSMYVVLYLVLYRLLEAPIDYGLVLKPILRSLHLIR